MRILFQLKYAFLAVLSTLILITSDSPPPSAPPCNMPDHPDYEPLMALYNATDGPNWTNSTGWGEDCDVCNWFGVSCKNDRVWRISMSSNKLNGFLPKNLVEIEFLEQIILVSNSLEGGFPLFLNVLPLLNRLQIGNNNFTGSIPNEISIFPSLTFLSLNGNNFEGSIISDIFNVPQLSNLDLSSNLFTGELPNNTGNATNLTRLVLSNNDLSGSLPDGLFSLAQLTQLQLQNNKFSGTIPLSFGGLASIDYLDLTNNSISGTLPTSIGFLTTLRTFFASANNIGGSLPNEITALAAIEKINLRNNELSGELPVDIGNMVSLNSLDLAENMIGGEIPTSLGDLPELKQLILFENELSGPFPAELVNLEKLTHINLRTNKLTGCFPIEYLEWCSIFTTNTFSGNCTFENPNFDQFCSGAPCNDGFDFQVNTINLCEGDELEIEFLPTYSYSAYQWSVPNQTSKILSTTATTSKYYYLTVTNSSGCTKSDSIYINVTSTDPGAESAEICIGNTVTINGEIFDEAGTFQQFIPRPGSCDSIVNVSITVQEGTTGSYAETICPGTTTTINGQEFGPGISSQTIDNLAGCDSIIAITIDEHPTYNINLEFDVCEGNTYNHEGNELSAGPNTLNLLTEFGCDSTVNIFINENLNTYETVSASFCPGGQVVVNNESFNVVDTYVRTLNNSNQCDSILTIIISEREATYGIEEATICEGDSVLIAGNYYLEGGTYDRTLTNSSDCDSFLTITVTELLSETIFLNEFICEEESFDIGTESFNTAGTFQVTLSNQNGCDSVINLNLTVISGEDQTINAKICAGTSYTFAGKEYSNSVVVQDSIVIAGCKSLTTLNLEVRVPIFYEYDEYICTGGYAYFHGYFYTEPTTQSVTLKTKQGCDSTVTMNLYVKEHRVVEIDTFLCSGESLFFDNQFYDSPGRIKIPRKTGFNCDSITYLNIELYETETDTFYTEVCEGKEIEFQGALYGAGEHSGTYDDGNCEQNFELFISEVEKLRYNEVITLCAGEESDFMEITYSDGGTYPLNLEINECEILENLIVIEGSNADLYIPQIYCEGTSFILGNKVISSSGNYPIISNDDCQNEFVSVLFVNGAEENIERTLEEGQAYKFNGDLYNEAGVYEFVVGSESGCPTMITLTLNIEKCGGLRTENIVLCEGESFEFFDQEITTSGIYEYAKPLVIGCDSLIQLNANVVDELGFSISGQNYLCPGEEVVLSGPEGYEYLWNNGEQNSSITVQIGGQYELTVFDENNCASYAEFFVEEIVFPSASVGIYIDNPTTCDSENGGIVIDVDMENEYLFSIDGGETFQPSNTFSALANGSYNIVLSDQLSRCTKVIETPVILESDGVPQIQEIIITPINDCLGQLGGIEIIPLDNDQDFQYSIDNGEHWSYSGIFENLDSDSYQVLMGTEGSPCINNLSSPITLENIGILNAELLLVEHVSCTDVEDGNVEVQILNGEPPYEVEWSNSGSGLSQSNLAMGLHSVTITDANGCVKLLDVEVNGTEIEDLLKEFGDTILCTNDTLIYEQDSAFQYIIFRGDDLYYEGANPSISEIGKYQIIITNGPECIADKHFEVEEIDLSELGINFLLSTEAVKGVEVVVVNVSEPMPEFFEWHYDTSRVSVQGIDKYSSGFTFKDSGSYNISLLTEVNGCLANFDKTIVVYADSSELGTYEEPETPIDNDRFGSWKVFENPSQGQFNVEVKVSSRLMRLELAVYDIYGSLIDSQKLLGKKKYLETFNLNNVGSGVYTVVLRFRNKQFSKNILIVK